MKVEFTVAEEVAIKEVKDLVEFYTDEEFEGYAVEDTYPHVVKASKMGLLIIGDDMVPTYKLREPIKTESGGIAVEEIKFLTRLTISQRKSLMKGLDPQKDSFELMMKSFAMIIGQPVAMLDKLSRFDLKALEQIVTLFL